MSDNKNYIQFSGTVKGHCKQCGGGTTRVATTRGTWQQLREMSFIAHDEAPNHPHKAFDNLSVRGIPDQRKTYYPGPGGKKI